MASLEEALNTNTAAVNRLADIMSKGGAATPAVTAGRGPGRPPKSKVTLDEVKAVANRVMEEKGRPVAVKLIHEHGAAQIADLPESKYPAFVAAAEVLLANSDENAGDEADAEL